MSDYTPSDPAKRHRARYKALRYTLTRAWSGKIKTDYIQEYFEDPRFFEGWVSTTFSLSLTKMQRAQVVATLSQTMWKALEPYFGLDVWSLLLAKRFSLVAVSSMDVFGVLSPRHVEKDIVRALRASTGTLHTKVGRMRLAMEVKRSLDLRPRDYEALHKMANELYWEQSTKAYRGTLLSSPEKTIALMARVMWDARREVEPEHSRYRDWRVERS